MQYFEPFPGNRGDELGNMASYRQHPHRGNDWGKKKRIEKKPIKAITNGRVKKVFWSDVLGHCLVQGSGDGFNWLYSHMVSKPVHAVGTMLIGGTTVVGLVGGGKKTPSGSASTGAHLHMAGCPAKYGANIHLVSSAHLVDVFDHIDANKAAVV